MPVPLSSTALPVGLHAPLDLRQPVSCVLAAAGLRVVDPGETDSAPVVALWDGTPRPEATDRWLGDSRPHLIVVLSRHRVEVGPFVDPGVTACLRCLEAAGALAVHDPSDGRAGARVVRRPPTGVLLLAVAAAAHDVARWHAGQVPVTWSATLTVDSELTTSRRSWWRHPHCGCSWGLAAGDGA